MSVQDPGPSVAYFSMEIALDAAMPTYSGGLGVLAGDSVQAAADLGVPMVAVTLLHRQGYFRQRLDDQGVQTTEPCSWEPEQFLEPLPQRTSISIEGREVAIRPWRFQVRGASCGIVPVYLLDTNLPENDEYDRSLTGRLYGGNARYRLCQEVLLGIGGIAVLRALGHDNVRTHHMNEGHAALLTLALLEERLGGRPASDAGEHDFEYVRRRCVFTVHTPVAYGHDVFPLELVSEVLGDARASIAEVLPVTNEGGFDLTELALEFSEKANAVSQRHCAVSQAIYPNYAIDSITNGVDAGRWVAAPIADLFERCLPGWRADNSLLRGAASIGAEELRTAHRAAKTQLLDEVKRRRGLILDPNAMTIGFGRRATGYKRADLIFSDRERLSRIVRATGPLQILFGGKAHPADESGRAAIQRIFEAAADLRDVLTVVYLEEYDMALARYLVAGTDLWLNNPEKPLEASGTSGMKAALNGVPSLSVLDGWWIEGHVEGVTGWAIGEGPELPANAEREAASLYDKLEQTVLPMFYQGPDDYARVMRSAIAMNGSRFNAQRMMTEYAERMYNQPVRITEGRPK